MHFVTRNLEHPYRNLIALFLCWKTLLLLVAFCSPGPGYDTSTSLLRASTGDEVTLISKLVRWDAIYYIKVSERGYTFEQEWAFGWGFTRFIALCTQFLQKNVHLSSRYLEAKVAVSIAHSAHLLATLIIYKLSLLVLPKSPRSLAFTAAALHIIAPAGLFLSAAHPESSCALLSFAGCLVFEKSFDRGGKPSVAQDLCLIVSGLLFGLATTLRSNGILNGLLLLEEALVMLIGLFSEFRPFRVRRLLAAGLGGLCVGTGFLLPQFIAYQEYCGASDVAPRVWCRKTLPSIYSFVQDHYWNCGLFRYWTVPNIPLFALATPTFVIMVVSAIWGVQYTFKDNSSVVSESKDAKVTLNASTVQRTNTIRNMAVSQLLLVGITLFTAHVQIITRLASAYPIWLWFLSMPSKEKSYNGIFVRFMVMYGIIQAGLYASFLPPA